MKSFNTLLKSISALISMTLLSLNASYAYNANDYGQDLFKSLVEKGSHLYEIVPPYFGSYKIIDVKSSQEIGVMRIEDLGAQFGDLMGLTYRASQSLGFLQESMSNLPCNITIRENGLSDAEINFFNRGGKLNLLCPNMGTEDSDYLSLSIDDKAQTVVMYLSYDKPGKPSFILKKLNYNIKL